MNCGEGLVPFEPFDLHILWYKTWRGHVATAKAKPEEALGYSMAAAIAQACYVTELALKINRLKNGGIIKRDENA